MASDPATLSTDQLQELLKLDNIENTEEELGSGTYGRIIKVNDGGTSCAAREIHSRFLLEVSQREFLEGCFKATQAQWPNVVRMLGIYYASQAPFPWLVMELLESNLKSYLENHTAEMVPFSTKISILKSILSDVAQGLDFLHNRKDIIHKCLTSNNILLTRHQPPDAKIGDLRVALIVQEQYRITYQNMRQDTLILCRLKYLSWYHVMKNQWMCFTSLHCLTCHIPSVASTKAIYIWHYRSSKKI